ncbi:MAG: hypothetical protein NTY37_06455 [Methanothrix sp.]|nr:hypothetical protein [Methanothrix sp.]
MKNTTLCLILGIAMMLNALPATAQDFSYVGRWNIDYAGTPMYLVITQDLVGVLYDNEHSLVKQATIYGTQNGDSLICTWSSWPDKTIGDVTFDRYNINEQHCDDGFSGTLMWADGGIYGLIRGCRI